MLHRRPDTETPLEASMSKMRPVVTALLLVASVVAAAQESSHVEFDVVSIKRHDPNDFGGGMPRSQTARSP
jgi:hypothetical protein